HRPGGRVPAPTDGGGQRPLTAGRVPGGAGEAVRPRQETGFLPHFADAALGGGRERTRTSDRPLARRGHQWFEQRSAWTGEGRRPVFRKKAQLVVNLEPGFSAVPSIAAAPAVGESVDDEEPS